MQAIISKLTAFFISFVLLLQSIFPFLSIYKNINTHLCGEVKPDSWVAVDGLGRTLPTYEEVGDRDNEKFVGMFYWIWHYKFAAGFPARNVTEILRTCPEAVNDFMNPVWESTAHGTPYYWEKPLLGYYSNLDEYVVRKHAELIADAGVDVIIFDCTNGTETWDEGYETLFKVFTRARSEGVNVPQIAFLLPFAAEENTAISLRNLYSKIYSVGSYRDLWFMWDNKPLIMARKEALDLSLDTDREIAKFFTFRNNDPSYFSDDYKKKENFWGWCSVYPQAKYGTSLCGDIEQMCVSVAQNAADGQLVAQNAPNLPVQGRCYTVGDYSYSFRKDGRVVTVDKNIENAVYYGLNFQQQWDYAIECDPDFIFVTGWNEWLAGRHSEWQGTENAFPDQFSAEHSRDIEPCAGELKDYYYYQLVANIRRFKGMDKPMQTSGGQTIDINAPLSQWDGVENVYHHYVGSTRTRSCAGWQGDYYENSTMRNDFRSVKVTYDDEYLYFLIETVNPITPHTDRAWMRLLLDTDSASSADSWEGFEYIINRQGATENTLTVEKSTGGWSFIQTGAADYTVNANTMQLRIPRSAVGMNGEVHFNFKLSDNMQLDGDIMDFYENGDVAPGGRFAFAF